MTSTQGSITLTQLLKHFSSDVDNMKDIIYSQPDDQLIYLWRQTWSKSQTQFCKQYNINQGNFSSWLKGQRKSPSSVGAVRAFLCSTIGIPVSSVPTVPVYRASFFLFNVGSVTMPTTSSITTTTTTTTTTTPTTITQTIPKGSTHPLYSKLPGLNYIMFIDGDNCAHLISRIVKSIEVVKDSAHIIYVVDSRSKLPETIAKYTHLISPCLPETLSKDATDHTITFLSTALHYLLPSQIEFIFVSHDGFVSEIVAQMNSLTRKSTAPTPAHLQQDPDNTLVTLFQSLKL